MSLLVIIGGLLFAFSVFKAWDIPHRPLWLDEIFSLLLIEEPDWSHYWQAQGSGMDNSPPGTMVLGRVVCSIIGSNSLEISLRWLFAGISLLGLWWAYLAFRQSVPPVAAWGGVIVIWAQPIWFIRSMEIRGYGPWFSFTALLLHLLAIAQTRRWTLWLALAIMLASFLASLFHHLALLSTALVAAGHFLAHRTWKSFLESSCAGLGAGLAVLLCLPLLSGQVAVTQGGAWYDDIPISSFLIESIPLALSLILLIVAWLGMKFRVSTIPPTWKHQFAGLALILMPLVLMLITIFGRPMLVHRYTMPGVLGWASLATLLLSRLPASLQKLSLLFLLLLGVYYQHEAVNTFHQVIQAQAKLESSIQELLTDQDRLLIFDDRNHYYPAYRTHLAIQNRSRLLLSDTAQKSFRKSRNSENLGGQLVERFFGAPKTIAFSDLCRLEKAYLITLSPELQEPELDYPGFQITKVADHLYSLDKLAKKER